MNTEEIKKLVENLEKLNLQEISTKKENFFDICGYPHYENVVSNVIVYFLNESSYKQLFLESILKCLNIESNEILVSEAEREVVVDENKRIDILMETQKYAIAIENKIYAGDQGQPYEKYKKYLKDNFKDKEKKMVLLSIFKKDENSKDKHLDHCITYRELLEKIKSKIGDYINDVKIEETILLKSFINNLENIMGNSNRNINDTNCNILFKNTNLMVKAMKELNEYGWLILEDFKSKLLSKNIEIEEDLSFTYPSKSYLKTIDYMENNLVLKDFLEYGKICLSLWLGSYKDNTSYTLSISVLNGYLNKNCKIRKLITEKSSWKTLEKKSYKYEDGIDLDQLIEDAKILIKQVKDNANDYFELQN